ncbi:hypothetical protein EJB05_26000, partial [Eragrostis curvula]
MSTSSPPAVSDGSPADVETGLKEQEKEEDAAFVYYVLLFVGMVVYVGKITNSWRQAGLAVLTLSPFMALIFCVLPIVRKHALQTIAGKWKRSMGYDLAWPN